MPTYKDSGVDTKAGDSLVDYLQKKCPVIGGFAGLFPLGDKARGYSLAACTDGVGTKLKLAFLLDKHDTIGIDLVAMCANDLITCGAKPLFFLDYYASGKLDMKTSRRIMDGILEGCGQADSMLLGGETAEMPGFYAKSEYDLAGFSVGIVKNSETIDGTKIKPGDVLLGLASSGFHSNGYSLVRKVFKGSLLKKYARELLTPTIIYVSAVKKLREGLKKAGRDVLGMAHITGGGLVENVPRFLPKNCCAALDASSWKIPDIMLTLREKGNIPEKEMWRTFNMGIGMVIAVRPESAAISLKLLPQAKIIGHIKKGTPEVRLENI